MRFEKTDAQVALSDQVIRFAQNELSPGTRERDSQREFSRDLWGKCADMGLLGLPIPEDFGGSGLDPVSTVIAIDALGYGCEDQGLVFSICAHMLACAVPVWLHGSDAQKETFLPRMCDGSLIAVNSMTESESGSDAFALKTKATKDGENYRITGSKVFGSNAPIADLTIAYAETSPGKGFMGGITAFLLPIDREGLSRGQTFDKMGLHTCPVGEIVFDGALARPDEVLGKEGSGGPIFNKSMEWERVCLVAAHCGHMQRLIETCVEFVKSRRSFGKPISEYQAVSHKIADMKMRLDASRLLVYRAASGLLDKSTVGLDASIAKLFVSEALVQTARDAVQIHGGNGYMTEYGMERSVRDALAATIYSGTSEMQRNLITKWLGI